MVPHSQLTLVAYRNIYSSCACVCLKERKKGEILPGNSNFSSVSQCLKDSSAKCAESQQDEAHHLAVRLMQYTTQSHGSILLASAMQMKINERWYSQQVFYRAS